MICISRRTLLATLSLGLASCARNQIVSTTPIAEGRSLKGSRVYVYSFLDLRDTEFGPSTLLEIDKLLAQEFAKSNVSVRALRFTDSEPGKYFVATSSDMTVPVKRVLDSNAQEERKFDANYRLVIFPSKMTLSSNWKFYDIRWEVFDVKSGMRVWATVSHGSHLTFWKADEDPQGRAKAIVDAVVGEMRKGGVI